MSGKVIVVTGASDGIGAAAARQLHAAGHRVVVVGRSPAKTRAVAEGLGVEVVMGNQIDGQLGTACAVTFGSAYELTSRRAGELSNFLDMSDDLLTEPLRIREGSLPVPPGVGLGVDVDPDKLAKYRTDQS